MLKRKINDGLPLLLIAALLSPSLATLTSWSSPSTWIRLPAECSLLCLALYAYRWRFCRAFFWLVAALVPLGLFCRVFYGSSITTGVLTSIELTSSREAWEMVRGYPSFACLAAIYLTAVGFGAVNTYSLPNPFTNRRLLRAALSCSLIVPCGAVMWLRATPPANYRPMTLAKNLKYILLNESFPLDMAYSEYAIFRGQRALREAVGRRASFAFPEVKRLTSDTGPEVYVLIIGESSRRESWSLFGYGRKTNPQLASLVGKGLIPFSGIRSNANLTIYSLPLALTGNAPAESRRASEEKSIVGLAKQAGFDTYWISAQEMFGGAAGPVGSIAEEASHVQFLDVSPRKGRGFEIDNGAYDEQVLRPFKEALAQETGNTKKVIVIHTMGSHYEYLSRVPAERRVFNSVGSRGTGTEAKSPAGEKLDAYDDSILYTDYVIKNVIDILAGLRYPSAMLYFSDHGERMYCEAYPHESFGHGFLPPSEDELDVPVLLWFSKSYERRYPPLAEAARANAHLKTSLGSVFDTFADLMRVDLRRTRRNQSLLSQSPGPASLDVFGVDGTVLVKGLPQRVCGPDHL